MPQEFHVLRCYQCSVFQVHQVKKVTKWSCKMCGEKQSLKKVFFLGTGADCRQNVQRLNMMQKESEKNALTTEIEDLTDEAPFPNCSSQESFHTRSVVTNSSAVVTGTKWNKYVETPVEEEEDCDIPESLKDCVLRSQISRGRKRKRHTEKTPDDKKPNRESSDTLQTSCSRLNALCGSDKQSALSQPRGCTKYSYSVEIERSARLFDTKPVMETYRESKPMAYLGSAGNGYIKGMNEQHSEKFSFTRAGYSTSMGTGSDLEVTEGTECSEFSHNRGAFQESLLESRQLDGKSVLKERNSGGVVRSSYSGSKWGKYTEVNHDIDSEELEDY